MDLPAAKALGIDVVRVPAYSPYAVAEQAMALELALNRKIHLAFQRTRLGNFSIAGFTGFDLHGRTAGVMGTGKIGLAFAKICKGFGMTVLGYDGYKSEDFLQLGGKYVDKDELFGRADLISLHLPLAPETQHIINKDAVAKMKRGVHIINTGRGPLIKTADMVEPLKTGHIGGLGCDVYEKEAGLYFNDFSNTVFLSPAAPGRTARQAPLLQQRHHDRTPGLPHLRCPRKHRQHHHQQHPRHLRKGQVRKQPRQVSKHS